MYLLKGSLGNKYHIMDKETAEQHIMEEYYPNQTVITYKDLGEKEKEDIIFYIMLDNTNKIGLLFNYYGSRGKLKTKLKTAYEKLTSSRENYEIVSVRTNDAFYINKSKLNNKIGNKLGKQILVDLSMIASKTTIL